MPRITYANPKAITDPELAAYIEDARLHGAPRPESQLIRAHVPEALRSFSRTWNSVFRNGVCDHEIKEMCRVYVSQSINCNY